MSHINVLSREVAELIAAGEVIERPASVIKELVENSIDSGARHITVEIKNGGTTYMRVSDDGSGIAFNDVPSAFLRHATSKISDKDDLDKIYTLGFRGEALASVCAVSKVEMMTKQRGDTYGTLYKIEGSTEISHEKSGCPDGTTIVIRDIFYNVPARAKFLKKDVTEANAVSNIVQKIALSHPETAVKMIRDNRMEFNSSGDGELISAVYAVFGRDFARDLLEVNYDTGRIKISGYVIKPLYAKNNRSFQNFFVNGRYIRSKLCSSALENAYESLIMTGKFPACVVMLEIPPDAVDVNIHPSKAEVRFTDEKSVADAIFFAVKNAFMENGLIYEFEPVQQNDWSKDSRKEPDFQQESLFTSVPESENIKSDTKNPEIKSGISTNTESIFTPVSEIEKRESLIKNTETPENKHFIPESMVYMSDSQNTGETSPIILDDSGDTEKFRYISNPVKEDNSVPENKEQPEIRIIGEAFGLYIIAEYGKNLVMIDKHAAHERIIFENLKERNCRQYSQKLLVGIKLLMTSEEIDSLETNTELLEDMGFVFDFSEKPYVTATAIPTFITDTDAEAIICEVAENLKNNKHNPQSGFLDDVLHTMACKAAIKANDSNTEAEMKFLAEQVLSDERIRHCPHGRPVMFNMTKSNIDHRFGRT
ncbi:MAG: DNA mismatch repair endonuclease MutL [Ruminococcus sp.]|nr:DNA mismatch repair endonuclease MutL [Ruminococcus sp.]